MFNSMLWKNAPKHIFGTHNTIEIAAYLTACVFNEGFTSILNIMTTMGIIIGPNAHMFATHTDNMRITSAECRRDKSSKKARTTRRNEQMALYNLYENEEDSLYGFQITD